MRFSFIIHPISEQTKNLMDLDEEGRLTRNSGGANLPQFCAEAHAAFKGRTQPMGIEQPKAPRVVDTFAGLVSSTGARRKGASTKSRWTRGRS